MTGLMIRISDLIYAVSGLNRPAVPSG